MHRDAPADAPPLRRLRRLAVCAPFLLAAVSCDGDAESDSGARAQSAAEPAPGVATTSVEPAPGAAGHTAGENQPVAAPAAQPIAVTPAAGAAVPPGVESSPPPISRGPGSGAEARGGTLRVDDPTFDWGTTFQGEQIRHAFRVTNTGKTAVKIVEVKTQCGCTVASKDLTNRTLEPGETVDVALTMDTSAFNTYTRKDADIVCEGDVGGDLKLWMQGDVKVLFTRTPHDVNVEAVRDAEALKAAQTKVSLTSSIEDPVAIKSLAAEKGLLAVDHRVTAAGRTFEVTLRPKIDLAEKVVIHTENLVANVDVAGKEAVIRIPAKIKVAERIQVLPSKSVFFPYAATKALADAQAPLPKRTLEVKSLGGAQHRFRVTGVEAREGKFKPALAVVEDGRLYRLDVELGRTAEPTGSRRVVKDTLLVRTDDPEVPVLEIPCTAQIGSPPQ
jgi:hypothetical protein